MTRRGTQRGFSMMEVVVALVVVSLALAIAASLVVEAHRHTLIEQSRFAEPQVSQALRQLRNDVRRASAGEGDGGNADGRGTANGDGDRMPDEPLWLFLPGNVLIEYAWDGSDLRRTMYELPEKTVVSTQVVLSDVVAFLPTWLPDPSRNPETRWPWVPVHRPVLAIDVQFTNMRLPGPLAAGGQRVFAKEFLDTRYLVLTLRGAGGTGW